MKDEYEETYYNEQLKTMQELPIYYGNDELRKKEKVVSFNDFVISNIWRGSIKKNLIILLGKDKEILRLKLDNIISISINKEFGEYTLRFIK